LQTKLGRRSGAVSRCAVLALALIAVACQSYRPRPLDLDSHQVAWAARSPGSATVRAVALSLGDSRPAVDGAFDPENGLSLGEAEATALVYNPDLRIARLRAAEASATARHAGRWEDPVFGFDGERILNGVSDPWILGASLAVTIPFSGRLEAEKREACAAERAAILRVVADEWALRIRVRNAWLHWSLSHERIEALRELLVRLEGIIGTATRLEEAGEITRIESRLFQAERASRTIELRSAETRAREFALEIKALMGLVPAAPLQFLPATDLGPKPVVDVTHNPHLAAVQAAYAVSEEALRLEIRKQYPDLTVAPGAKTEEGDERVTLGLDLPIPLWNRNRKAIAQAHARRETARAEYETSYEVLVAKTASAELALDVAIAQRTELESVLVPLLEEQAREVQRVVDLGRVDTLVMLDTLVRRHEARVRLIEMRLQEAISKIQLQELAGPARWRTEQQP
jgi:outer membrane protein, heavy metal efflux system